MIKYNNNSINDWYFDTSDIVKVYRNNAVRYQKIYDSSPTPPFNGKWLATYEGGTTSSAECDSTSAITVNEINKRNLTDVVIGDCVTSIGNQAFYDCEGLTSVTIGSGVISIGDGAFHVCDGLTSVTIPNSVTSIGEWTFGGCSSLTSVTIYAATPPTLGSYVFFNTNNCPIYVPATSVNAYKSASGWSEYASRIQAIQ